ncbi:MAG: thiolase family protein [Nitrospinota bacterium]|nr:MAG: thiolase family protein [Nitrospinota bacterium]
MNGVYIAGVGMTRFGKTQDSLRTLLTRAAQQAVGDPDRFATIDAVYVGVMNAEEFTGEGNIATAIVDHLGLYGVPAFRIETASSTGAAALHAAFYALTSGHFRNILVLAGEKMTHLHTARTTKILAEVIELYERNCGASMPALAAMITQRYMSQYKISLPHMQRILSAVAIKNHYNGSLNPYAQFQKEITREKYLESREISSPLRLYDCAPITDGAAAVVLTTDKTDIRIIGVGQGTDTLGIRFRDSFTSFRSTQLAAKRAYSMAQITPKEVDFAEVHDAFTTFEIIGTEDLGFFPPGKGGRAVEKGLTALDGELPINASGGLKARGHPVGASGLAQIVEIVWQMRGEVDERRQLKKTNVGLAQSIGGLGNNNFVTILERTDRQKVQVQGWENAYPFPLELPPRPKRDPESATKEGRLETFTILYTTPEGFPSPLQIGLVEDDEGHVLLARSRRVENLKVGTRVIITKIGDTYYYFTRSSFDKFRIIGKKKFRDLTHNELVRSFQSKVRSDLRRLKRELWDYRQSRRLQGGPEGELTVEEKDACK